MRTPTSIGTSQQPSADYGEQMQAVHRLMDLLKSLEQQQHEQVQPPQQAPQLAPKLAPWQLQHGPGPPPIPMAPAPLGAPPPMQGGQTAPMLGMPPYGH